MSAAELAIVWWWTPPRNRLYRDGTAGCAQDLLCLPACDHLGEKSDVRVPTGVVATSTMDGPNRASVWLASYTVSGLPAYVHLNGFASTLLKYSMNASSRS